MSRLFGHIINAFNQNNFIHFEIYAFQEDVIYIVNYNNVLYVYNDNDNFELQSLQLFTENSIDEQNIRFIEMHIENRNIQINWLFYNSIEMNTYTYHNSGNLYVVQN